MTKSEHTLRFAAVIAGARHKRGMSQAALAKLILREDGVPITAQYIGDIELGKRLGSDHIISEMARELDLSSDYLYFVAGRIPPDLRQPDASPARIIAACAAMRQVLQQQDNLV